MTHIWDTPNLYSSWNWHDFNPAFKEITYSVSHFPKFKQIKLHRLRKHTLKYQHKACWNFSMEVLWLLTPHMMWEH